MVHGRLETDVEMGIVAPSPGAARDRLGARQVQQVHGAARGIGQHQGFGDRELLRQRRPRPVIAFEVARPRALHLLDEHPDELGLLAVKAQGDASVTAVSEAGRRHLAHQQVEMAEIVGLDDAHILRHDIRSAVRRASDRFGMAVLHSPDPAPELAALGYDLIIAGHTHGGQVRMPIVGALVTNSQLPRRLSAGLIRMGPAFVNISAGLGTSKYAPFRFLCPPEATLLELEPRGT